MRAFAKTLTVIACLRQLIIKYAEMILMAFAKIVLLLQIIIFAKIISIIIVTIL